MFTAIYWKVIKNYHLKPHKFYVTQTRLKISALIA